MNREAALRRNIVLFRLLSVFGANGLTTSAIYFFFIAIKGVTSTEALFLIGFAALAKALSEVPTGLVADMVSRKRSICIGYVILVLSWMAILFTENFTALVLVTAFWGIGRSFLSGADEALLYDSLIELKISQTFKTVLNLSHSIEFVAFAITIFIGGVLGGINLSLPIFANILLLTLSAAMSFLLVEPITTTEGEKIEHVGYLLHTQKSLATIFSRSGFTTGLLGSFLALALILGVFKSTKNILSPILDTYGYDLATIGFIISAVILIKAAGAFLASTFTKQGNERKEIAISLAMCIGGLLLITVIGSPILQLIIFSVIFALENTILTNIQSIIHAAIESKQRSTILSLLSLFARSSEMLFLTSFGWILNSSQLHLALLFTACWLSTALFIMLIAGKKKTTTGSI